MRSSFIQRPPRERSAVKALPRAAVRLWVSSVAALLGLTAAHAWASDNSGPVHSSTFVIAAPAPPPAPLSTFERVERGLSELSAKAFDATAEISSIALSLIGVDYKFGGNTPDQGLDCSGFVRYVFQHATGISLPRTSREQSKVGQSVDKAQLQPGDLVFFNTRRFQFSHVGVYLGGNRFIHSPSRGGAVEIVDFDNRYWQKAFNGARRILQPGSAPPVKLATPEPRQ
ncbi:MAG: peptidoglycan endopeptidase [Betaproteobacteria bacterium]|nr:MAG: peptidoglycan endopeptidase [Betaproteobacteria bacterium]